MADTTGGGAVRRSVLTRSGLALAVDVHDSSGLGAPVILLHGGGQTRHSWSNVADMLAEGGHETWTVDLRGHGESDWSVDGDYSTESMVEDLVEVCDRLPAPPIVVGASMGGLVALMAEGLLHPGRFHALVLVDIATRIEAAGVDRIVSFMGAAPDGFASLEEAAESVAAYRPDQPRRIGVDGLRKNLRQGADGRWRWHWDPAFLEVRNRDSRRDPEVLGRAAAGLSLPVLLVRGRMSDMVTEESAQLFLEQCRHARYVDVADAGHMVVGDRNDHFCSAVLDFIAEIDGSPEVSG